MKKIVIAFALFCTGTIANAQHKGSNLWYLNWEPGTPVGSNFVSQFSWRGGSFGYSRFISDNTTVGVEMNWNSYYEYKPSQTYTQGTIAVTTDFYKYLYSLPLTIRAAHYFKTSFNKMMPYIGLGIGTAYGEQKLFYNIYESGTNNWGFCVIPEIGTNIRLSDNQQAPLINLGVRYKYSTNSWKDVGLSGVSTFNFYLGLSFLID